MELESVRGVAALLVVVHHISGWNRDIYNIGFVQNAYLMVELFFVLSGFVIFRAYRFKIVNMKELARFQFLRFGRLYPVHLLFLFAFVSIEILKYVAAVKLGINSPNSTPFKENNLDNFIKQLFLLQAIGNNTDAMTFNFPAWSISTEFYTYLIFGAALLIARSRALVVFAGLEIISLALLVTQLAPDFDLLLRCIAGFFLGCLTADLAARFKVRLPGWTVLIAAAAMIAFLQLKTDARHDPVIYFLTSALILTLVLSDGGLIKSVLNWRLLTWLGTISYSVYMSHGAIVWAAAQVLRVALKAPEIMIEGRSTPQLPMWGALIAYAVVIPLVLLLSQVVYRVVEKPCREWSRRVAFKDAAAPTAARN